MQTTDTVSENIEACTKYKNLINCRKHTYQETLEKKRNERDYNEEF